jgi:hypothetical protein
MEKKKSEYVVPINLDSIVDLVKNSRPNTKETIDVLERAIGGDICGFFSKFIYDNEKIETKLTYHHAVFYLYPPRRQTKFMRVNLVCKLCKKNQEKVSYVLTIDQDLALYKKLEDFLNDLSKKQDFEGRKEFFDETFIESKVNGNYINMNVEIKGTHNHELKNNENQVENKEKIINETGFSFLNESNEHKAEQIRGEERDKVAEDILIHYGGSARRYVLARSKQNKPVASEAVYRKILSEFINRKYNLGDWLTSLAAVTATANSFIRGKFFHGYVRLSSYLQVFFLMNFSELQLRAIHS